MLRRGRRVHRRGLAAVLAYRGDYDEDIDGDTIKMCVDIAFKPDGTFDHHVFQYIPLSKIKSRIRDLARRLGA